MTTAKNGRPSALERCTFCQGLLTENQLGDVNCMLCGREPAHTKKQRPDTTITVTQQIRPETIRDLYRQLAQFEGKSVRAFVQGLGSYRQAATALQYDSLPMKITLELMGRYSKAELCPWPGRAEATNW